MHCIPHIHGLIKATGGKDFCMTAQGRLQSTGQSLTPHSCLQDWRLTTLDFQTPPDWELCLPVSNLKRERREHDAPLGRPFQLFSTQQAEQLSWTVSPTTYREATHESLSALPNLVSIIHSASFSAIKTQPKWHVGSTEFLKQLMFMLHWNRFPK